MTEPSYYYSAYNLTIQVISAVQEAQLEPQIKLLKEFALAEHSELLDGYSNENKRLFFELKSAEVLQRKFLQIEDESDRILIATMPQAENMFGSILLPNAQCLVGYAAMGINHQDKTADLYSLYTRAKLGVPIGSALMAQVLNWAIERGHDYPIDLAALDGSYAWYIKNGFKGSIMHMQLPPEKFQATRRAITEKIGASQLITTPKLVL